MTCSLHNSCTVKKKRGCWHQSQIWNPHWFSGDINWKQLSQYSKMFPNKMAEQYIENTTRLRGNMKFLFLCWKIFHEWAQRRVKYTRREIFISPSGHVMFYLLYKHQWNTKQYFGVKGMIYYEAIATVIFSHVKISSFCTKAHPVFHWC